MSLKSVKKLALLLCVLLIALAFLPAVAESATQLQLTFIGMYASSDGGYAARNLSGTFEVYQNGKLIGRVEAGGTGSAPLALSVSGNVQLVPVMDTIAEEISVNEDGYTVSIVQGRTNYAPVVVYAQAGLFRVHTESQADFALISEEGQVVLSFSTDSKGDYALPVAIPAGQYTLRMESASLAISRWRDKIINLPPYTGPDSVVLIDASYYYTPEITLKPATPTPEPTATPVVTPSPTPYAAPTAMPEGTSSSANPTESLSTPQTPALTPAPTATPTATPEPVNGTLVLRAYGDPGANANFSVTSGGFVYSEGVLKTGYSARVPELPKGNYFITVILPDDVMLTALNGYRSMQRRTAQWVVTVSAGRTSLYEVEMSLVGSISGEFVDLTGVQVNLAGSEIRSIVADGVFSAEGLVPDVYTVTAFLPQGNYAGDGWSFVDSAGQTLAICKVELAGGAHVELPTVVQRELGSISGVVTDLQGTPLPGVDVTLYASDGTTAGTAVSAADGCWVIEDLENDAYAIQYAHADGLLIPAGMAAVSEATLHVEVAARQAQPASLRVRVFDDANNNGVLGKNEQFLPGAVITLISREESREIIVASVVTDSEGEAVLSVPAASYILRCEMPEDYGFAPKGTKALISNSSMEESIERLQEMPITLAADEPTEIGIGAMEMATLRGTVWHDLNGDGLWQSDEPGVPGMVVCADGVRNGLHYETLTDADGRYEIRQIRNGTYNVSYNVPDGYVFTYKANGPRQQRSLMTTEADRVGRDQIVFEKGDVVDEQNIGLVSECVIEGVCFLDANYNGIYDEGEQVLAGVQVELFRQSNNKRLQTVVSDENGVFRFGNVRSDTFKLKALLPTGYTFTMNVPGNSDANQFPPKDGKREQQVFNITAENGGITRVNVGAISHGSVSGVVYYDDNFSGDWETGEKIAMGITVTLLNSDGDAIKTAKTNKSGAYTFDDLVPGVYSISVTPAAGYAFTTVGEGSVVRNASNGLGVSDGFEVALGASVTGADAGMIVPARVSGKVIADANDNGVADAGEKGLQGTVVALMNDEGVVAEQTIGADGAYTFSAVLPGSYYLRYDLPDAAVFSPVVGGGNQLTGEDGVASGEWFTVAAGQNFTAPLCGGLYLAEISGYAFGDSDGSGVQETGENRLAGMMLTLTPTREDLSERIVMTGADGSFSFLNVHPDTYTLTLVCPDGYVLSLLPDVTMPVQHGLSEQSVPFVVGMGGSWTEQPLGCVKPAAYTGQAWLDENLNGLRDAGERPAASETITVIEQRSGEVVAQLTTAEDGSFRAEGLAPGLYTLTYAIANDVDGASAGDSTFTRGENVLVMADIPVSEGSEGSGALLGLVRETMLQGHVWLDHDGEIQMVSGAEVTLMQNGEALAAVTTDADGLYTFDGLMPGEYAIHVELPAAHLPLQPGDRRTADGTLISILASIDGASGLSDTICVEMAMHQLQLDVGSVKPGRLGDLCWLDLNGNGLQDYGEGGLPGVKIELLLGDVVVATTVSDQYGYYCFEALYPGEYFLRATAPAEVNPTVKNTDLPIIASILNADGVSDLVPVESDGVNYAADMGFVLVKEGVYPEGYGEGTQQDWTKIK